MNYIPFIRRRYKNTRRRHPLDLDPVGDRPVRRRRRRLAPSVVLGGLVVACVGAGAALFGLASWSGEDEANAGAARIQRELRLPEPARPKAPEPASVGVPVSESRAPERLAPEPLAPEGLAPEGLAPEGLAPEDSAPEDSAPEDSAPEGSVPKPSARDATSAPETSVARASGNLSPGPAPAGPPNESSPGGPPGQSGALGALEGERTPHGRAPAPTVASDSRVSHPQASHPPAGGAGVAAPPAAPLSPGSPRTTAELPAEPTPAESTVAEPSIPAEATRRSVVVERGDSLYRIFKALGLRQADLQQVLGSGKQAQHLADIRPGRELELFVDTEHRLQGLVYELDDTRALHVVRTEGDYTARLVETEVERRRAIATGTIDSSLFLAGQRAGLSDNLIMRMVEIFAWDVDFALDIREGDRFSVIFEELYKEGEKIGEGNIVAAEFVNRDRAIRALRYTDASDRTDYYSPDGLSMRKAFLRTPVNFSRISSRFNLRRKHPILHSVRAHRGVDYAAPTGTPVKATGDGKVVFTGRKGGYGKTVKIRHGSTYTTVYAHLSRFARGLRTGRRVEQGETIGYVGSTGLATGPHLHYEFRVRGVHRNPLTVALPEANPIPGQYREHFLETTAPLVAQLDRVSSTQLAVSE